MEPHPSKRALQRPLRTSLRSRFHRRVSGRFARNAERSEKNKGGGNSGEGKTYHKAPPQKQFLDPPTYDTIFPPPPLFTQSHSPYRKRAQTRQIPLSEASKTGFWRGHFIVRFPPPKITRYVLPPPPLCEF